MSNDYANMGGSHENAVLLERLNTNDYHVPTTRPEVMRRDTYNIEERKNPTTSLAAIATQTTSMASPQCNCSQKQYKHATHDPPGYRHAGADTLIRLQCNGGTADLDSEKLSKEELNIELQSQLQTKD